MRNDMHSIKGLAGALLLASLVACGGGDFSSTTGGSGSGGSGSGGSVAIGTVSGSTFLPGELSISVNKLSAGGSSSISVSLVNADGSFYTTSADITFSSVCASTGLASFTPAVVTTTSGTATTLYTATGCSGSDSITASTTIGTTTISATGTITVQAPVVTSIQFIPPAGSNTVIALQGTGGTTSAKVTFQVNDANGNAVPNQTVKFSLSPTTGDASVDPASGVTDSSGQVSTFVNSGTQHYSVSVIATVETPQGPQSTGSNALTISVGLPTQGNFSIAPAQLTANNAFSIDGITDSVTVRLADIFSNPAPDGTAVAFVTNFGLIEPQCFTVDGACTVTWTSKHPLPTGAGNSVAGETEILAYTQGEESFDDLNGDGVFDGSDTFSTSAGTGDSFMDQGSTTFPTVDDIGEVYLDGGEALHFVGNDFYQDFNKDHTRNGPDGKYHGFGCTGTASISCGATHIMIGKQTCIMMSSAGALIAQTPSTTTIVVGSQAILHFDVSDANGHSLAGGTTVSLLQTGVLGFTVNTGEIPFTFDDDGCGSSGHGFDVSITPTAGATTFGGTIQLSVVTPGTGGRTTKSQLITLTP